MPSVLRLKYVQKPVATTTRLRVTAFALAGYGRSLLLSPPGPNLSYSFKTLKSDYVSLLKTSQRLLVTLRVKVGFLQGPRSLSDATSSTLPSLTVPQPLSSVLFTEHANDALPQGPCPCHSLCLERCSRRKVVIPSFSAPGPAQGSPQQGGVPGISAIKTSCHSLYPCLGFIFL